MQVETRQLWNAISEPTTGAWTNRNPKAWVMLLLDSIARETPACISLTQPPLIGRSVTARSAVEIDELNRLANLAIAALKSLDISLRSPFGGSRRCHIRHVLRQAHPDDFQRGSVRRNTRTCPTLVDAPDKIGRPFSIKL